MNTQIYEEATQWLIKHRKGNLTNQEKRQFDAWLRLSPQHMQGYLEMSAVWEDVPALDASWNPTPEELIARARSEGNIYPLGETETAGITARSEVSRRGSMRSFAVAATFLLVILGVTTWYWLNRNTYTTNVGEQRSIVLADGSTVELNSRSRLRVRYTDTQRDVDLLEGQALFRVARNTARPFIVHSGTANVRAVGTQFDVYRKNSGTVVTVVEGKVAVLTSTPDAGAATSELPISQRSVPTGHTAPEGTGRNSVLLAAGEQLVVTLETVSAPRQANVASATAWTRHSLVFDVSPLTEVVQEFNRYNTRQLVITSPEIAKIHVSGVFSSVDPELLLRFLREQPELVIEESDKEIRISSR